MFLRFSEVTKNQLSHTQGGFHVTLSFANHIDARKKQILKDLQSQGRIDSLDASRIQIQFCLDRIEDLFFLVVEFFLRDQASCK